MDRISRLSGFDGNIDQDSIDPFIFMAQKSEIKRILGTDLYNKINNGIQDNNLSDDYLTIFDEHIGTILTYWTCSYYLQLGVVKVSQNGAYLVAPDKTEQVFDDKTGKIANKYEALAIGLEHKLVEYLNTLSIPEWKSPDQTSAKSSFNWLRVK
jgi:predicted PilT family ATPase